MKKSSSLIALAIGLAAIVIFPSCKKEMTGQKVPEIATNASVNGDCRSVAFNVFLPQTHYWKTLMQKWYDGNGKVKYLKAFISGEDGFAGKNNDFTQFEINLDWGEVTRFGNQVYLNDAVNNKTLLRVTMDPQERPVATYLYNDHASAPFFRIDTSYYYYTGSRLDIIYMTGERRLGGSPYPYWNKFELVYDNYGNIRQIKGWGDSRINFIYDYSRPVQGTEQTVQFLTPLRILEYMELLKLPVNHLLEEVVIGAYIPGSNYPDEIFPIRIYNYEDHLLNADGLVYSFSDVETLNPNAFYTGWQCGSILPANPLSRKNSGIGDLEQFKRMFPPPVK
ncbi:MAG TPA: hypothetical protein VGD17_08070 [Chitinophagaceae bacterium]